LLLYLSPPRLQGEEHLLCSAEVGHSSEEGSGDEDHLEPEHGISIATGATHWHCVDAEPAEANTDEPLSRSKAWGYTMAAVLIGSVGCVVILVRASVSRSLAGLEPLACFNLCTWVLLCSPARGIAPTSVYYAASRVVHVRAYVRHAGLLRGCTSECVVHARSLL
jgi:hypothetical protein